MTIAYDGTDFCGWQKQEPPAGMNIDAAKVLTGEREFVVRDDAPPAAEGEAPDTRERMTLRTVQEVVEQAVRHVVRERIVLHGASRTDSGVHARGQVAAFTCSDAVWPVERGMDKLMRAINSRLPEDVLVSGVEVVPDTFNPITDCVAKGYSYTLHESPHRALWDRRFVRHVWAELDVGKMEEAAKRFVGEHDFAAFAAAGHGRVSTVRTVFECGVGSETARQRDSETGGERRIRIEISGNGFLWNMVRIVAGTLVEVGRGKMSADDVTAAIEGKDRRKAGPTMPPTGLCLEWVRYGA